MYTVTSVRGHHAGAAHLHGGGVSRVQVMGEQSTPCRVQVDPDKLAAHNIGIDEVQRAIGGQQQQIFHGAN